MDNLDSKKIAGRHYDAQMKNSTDEFEQGLNLTHEQVFDNYMEGTVDGFIEKKNAPDVPLKDL